MPTPTKKSFEIRGKLLEPQELEKYLGSRLLAKSRKGVFNLLGGTYSEKPDNKIPNVLSDEFPFVLRVSENPPPKAMDEYWYEVKKILSGPGIPETDRQTTDDLA